MFDVRVFHSDTGAEVAVPGDIHITPQRWSASAVGGYDRAEITVTGEERALWFLLNWLGYDLRIYTPRGSPCWRGRIWSVVVEGPGLAAGWTLEGMANRIRVAYVVELEDGTTERRTTPWAENTTSIDRFGTFELQLSQSDSSDAQALAYRDRELQALGNPQPVLVVGTGSDAASVTIECRGLWYELEQTYYENLLGIEAHDVAGNATQLLGYGFTSTYVQFEEDGELEDFSGQFLLSGLEAGQQFIVSGSTSNNGQFTVAGQGEEGHVYTSTSITFEFDDNIKEPNYHLDFLSSVAGIRISGSSLNDGYWSIDKYNAGNWVEVNPNTMQNEALGNNVSIIAPQSITTDEGMNEEEPGASVTVTAHGVKVAQSFNLMVGGSWSVNDVAIRIQRVGAPTDNITIAIHASAAGTGLPGTLLESATLEGDDISDVRMNWYSVNFANTLTLSSGTSYWLVVSRTGANSAQSYYLVDMDDDGGYPSNSCWLWTANNFWTHRAGSSMPFRIRGSEQTTKQITDIVSAAGQRIRGIELDEASGVYSNQYRDGDATAMTELIALLESGFSDGGRMLAYFTEGETLRVYRDDADPTLLQWHYTMNAELQNPMGADIEAGRLVVAQYALVPDAPIPLHTGLNPFYIERCEYDANAGRYLIEPRRGASPFSLPGVTRG